MKMRPFDSLQNLEDILKYKCNSSTYSSRLHLYCHLRRYLYRLQDPSLANLGCCSVNLNQELTYLHTQLEE